MAYKIEFEIRTAIPTLQNSFDSRINLEMGGGGGEPIKAGRTRVYLKASAEDTAIIYAGTQSFKRKNHQKPPNLKIFIEFDNCRDLLEN